MQRWAPFGAVLLVACGAHHATEPPPTATPPPTVVVPPSTEPCAGPCLGQGATCTDRGPDWICTCTQILDVNCGGAPRQLAPPVWGWSCSAADPTRDRGDGCSFAEPADGASCEGERTCRYPDGPCGLFGRDAACAGGTWHLTPYAMPPPP